MPVQFSVHRLDAEGDLSHAEYLAEAPGRQRELVDALELAIGDEGSVISWNKSFEAACNRRMAELVPDKQQFLDVLDARTHDLMDPFASDYVDAPFRRLKIRSRRSCPYWCPSWPIAKTDVHDGTGAMQAWLRFIACNDAEERSELRRQLLAYCRLDTLAMVEILRFLQALR